ncbi:thioredoxin domain-containing protein [Aestuariimicrobium kwangyangense]|uniref:thioredoxin domain-containing protein n=1 Tax=Aestuariimicrobium kwangyangense TaxID=396389 RepID=UPI0003B470F0|nr:thioredoxin domain-containing protein [Aestuariimicrobium kwangyangense]
MPNRLADSTSPYLQQHAHQPVDWQPWDEAAFAEARERQVPVFLSVGYAACHWCHVMAHESFDDPEIAALLNENFVAIKVDREEHPDVDAVHMFATQALTGRGGWPMSAFLTPEGDPFFAGTYFPPEPAHGLPSFRQVVEALSQAWTERRDEVLSSASTVRGELAKLGAATQPNDALPGSRETLELLGKDYDLIHGGFGGAPKFPPPTVLDALLVKGDPTSLDMAQLTCEAMARGGVHDQLGGGFHRYSVDAGWAVPHFEKMLYDNALLLGTYCRAWRRTADHDPDKRALFERVIYGTVEFLVDELRTEQGGFAASLDADSCDIRGAVHEGIYYVWNRDLLVDALGSEDAEWAADVFHVTVPGTFEHGLSTLQLRKRVDWARLEPIMATLKKVRDERFRPARDDKVVAAWNGLLIDSLVTAALMFDEPEWLEVARACAEMVWSTHVVDGRLVRTSRDGVAGRAPGVTEDHAALALGFGQLAGATGDGVWLERATWLLDRAEELFAAEDGGWFDAEQQPTLPSRPRELTDNPTPSATATMVHALRLVGLLSGDDRLLDRSERGAATTWATVAATPRFAGWSLADALVREEARRGLRPGVAVIVDEAGDPFNELTRAAWRMAPAGTAIVTGRPGTVGFGDNFEDRGSGGRSRAYVCRGTVCFDPVDQYTELKTPLWSRC